MNWSNWQSGPEVCKLMGDVLFSREIKTLKLTNDRITDLEKQVKLIFSYFSSPWRGRRALVGVWFWCTLIFIHQTNSNYCLVYSQTLQLSDLMLCLEGGNTVEQLPISNDVNGATVSDISKGSSSTCGLAGKKA